MERQTNWWVTAAKLALAVLATMIIAWLFNTILARVWHQWTLVSMAAVKDNMGNQINYQRDMGFWVIVWWVTLAVGIGFDIGVWYLLFKSQLRRFVTTTLMALTCLLLLAGCKETHSVLVTPPNYVIVVDLASPSNQETGNNFGNGELLNVSQVTVVDDICAMNSNDRCPDKLVAQVPGSPESRIYTQDVNTGTQGANQALCFEASGTNGCLDFSVTAIIERDNARCYANKMGVKPVIDGDKPSRFNFMAMPLADALDTRVIQIAGKQFALAVANKSPLTLALEKFALFEETKPKIIATVMEQTCITITDMGVNGGIVWSSPAVQATIDDATVVLNRLDLAQKENEVAQIELSGVISRTQELANKFGLDAALRLMAIQKWDGTYLPAAPQSLLQSTGTVSNTNTVSP